MEPRLLEILKKAKAIDERAKNLDSSGGKTNTTPTPKPKPRPTMSEQISLDPTGSDYVDMVKKSKLPPEIQRLMIESPIPQSDMPGTFSMDEAAIREVNPNYGVEYSEDDEYDFMEEQRHLVKEVSEPRVERSVGVDERSIRKMIAEEIARALPSIVENYFDKKMIKENIEVLKALKVRRKNNNL
jgi:hypothetical protein